MAAGFIYSLQGMLAHQGETYDLVPEKASWPEGEWTKEPDAVVFQHRGFWCAVMRLASTGSLVGYVRVPKEHPWYGVEYSSFYELSWNGGDAGSAYPCPEAHGGLTYSSFGDDGDTDGWYFGFDCNHYGDFAPNPKYQWGSLSNGVYRNVGYVYEECLSLARQAEKAEPLPRMLDQAAN